MDKPFSALCTIKRYFMGGYLLSVTEKQKKAHAPHYYSFFIFQFSVFSKTKSLPLGGKVVL